MLTKDFHVSLQYCKSLSSKIFQFSQMEKNLEDEQQKLQNDYRKQVNMFFLEYIDYRCLLLNNYTFKMKDSNLMLSSSILEADESSFFTVIKFFKSNPEILASTIADNLKDLTPNQRTFDFILLNLYVFELNQECTCSQKENAFRFIATLVNRHFEPVKPVPKEKQNISLLKMVFDSVRKMPKNVRMLKRFYGSLIDTFFVLRKLFKESPSVQNETSFDELTTPKKERVAVESDTSIPLHYTFIPEMTSEYDFENNGVRKCSGSFMLIENADNFSKTPKTVEIDGVNYFSSSLDFITSILVELCQRFIPQEMILIFYLIRKHSFSKKSVSFTELFISLFLNTFILGGTEASQVLHCFYKITHWPSNDIKEILDVYVKYVRTCEESQILESPLNQIFDVFFKHVQGKYRDEKCDMLLEAQLNKRKRALASLKDTRSVNDTMLETPNEARETTPLSNKTSFTAKVSHIKESESTSSKRLGRGDMKGELAEPNSFSKLSQILSNRNIPNKRKSIAGTSSYNDNCSIHIDAHCISIGELADLLEIYKFIDNSGHTVQSLKLAKFQIKINQQQSGKEWLSNDNFFLLFNSEMFFSPVIEEEPQHAAPFPEIEYFFSQKLLNEETFEAFSGQSLAVLAACTHCDFVSAQNNNSSKPSKKPQKNQNSVSLKDFSADPLFASILISDRLKMKYDLVSDTQAEADPDLFKVSETIKGLPHRYDDKIRTLSGKFNLLYQKRKEIFAIANLSEQLSKIKNVLYKGRVCTEINKHLKKSPIHLCLIYPSEITSDQIPLKKYKVCKSNNCREKTDRFWASPTEPELKVPLHVHLLFFSDLVEFLIQYRFVYHCAEDLSVIEKVKEMVDFAKQAFSHDFLASFDREFLKMSARYVSQSEMIDLLNERVNSELQLKVFYPQAVEIDSQFLKMCQSIYSFKLPLSLKDPNHARLLERSLGPAIRALSQLSKSLTYKAKMRHLEGCMKVIASIFNTITEKVIGADELFPIFIFCLIRSLNTHFVSSKCMINIAMDNEDRFGQKGFILTQLEASEKQIINYVNKKCRDVDLSKAVLENEVTSGSHFNRRRSSLALAPFTLAEAPKMWV